MLNDDLLENIDGLSIDPDDLRAYAERLKAIRRASRKTGEYKRADRDTLKDLALYASLKADAMEARLSGDIPLALNIESCCDRLYLTLPEYARW